MSGLGIGDFETAAGQGVGIIHHRAAEIIRAESVHPTGTPKMAFKILGPFFIEDHAVLQARAAALFNVKAQSFAGPLGSAASLALISCAALSVSVTTG